MKSAHLQTGCVGCSGRLAEIHAVLDLMPFSLPSRKPPIGACERLLAHAKLIASPRLIQSSEPMKMDAGAHAVAKMGRRGVSSAWRGGAIAAGIGILVLSNTLLNQKKSLDSLHNQLSLKDGEVARLITTVREARESTRLIASSTAQLIAFMAPNRSPMPLAESSGMRKQNHFAFMRPDYGTFQQAGRMNCG